MSNIKESKAEAGTSMTSNKRLLRVDQVWSRKDRQIHFIKSASAKTKQDRFSRYSLVVRRIIDRKGALSSVEVDIKSPKLTGILINIFKNVEGLRLTRSIPMLDVRTFFYARGGLEESLQEESSKDLPDKDLIEDIRTALAFLDEECESTTANLKSLLPHGDIMFDHLWAIFPPHSVLYSSTNALQQPRALGFSSARYTKGPSGEEVFLVSARMIHHSGDKPGWAMETFQIRAFEGSQKIRSLPIYPLQFHSDPDGVRLELLARGHVYLELAEKPTCKDYRDLAVKSVDRNRINGPPRGPPGIPPGMLPPGMQQPTEHTGELEDRFDATGRIMVDPVAFSKHKPNSLLLEPRVTQPVDTKKLTDDEIMLCNYKLFGFSFRAKEWGAFAVSQTTEVAWNESAFDRLILDDKKRRMIRVLIESHRTDDMVFEDIVSGKGQGLVGLLSGSPGVGKTLTAEAVAELSRRPLYIISAGELGVNILATDDRLSMALEITRRWGCVLLIDEADVFLHKRDIADLNRNALVSLFLRRLEYFQGIMILTTNRNEDIDEAFKSRIHFKFHYPPLDAKSRFTLWKDFLGHIPSDITISDLSDEELQALAEHPLNGREIKNAVSCAASIVRSTQEPMTITLLKDILGSLFDDCDQYNKSL
ncbi:hypothetical protein BP6252_09997 [Coleophoma cylindrospora]|uniref:AAA+ ATPase domain-containing protein n=1 Tax=Coleophoma cylindrospora TaxID=1849047 RepID=A0A3D8QX42_9HELO|nr:hypothetical protein BP6252_09997 [Coleophoma cylindrospora]